jgi:hypothetical protein
VCTIGHGVQAPFAQASPIGTGGRQRMLRSMYGSPGGAMPVQQVPPENATDGPDGL